MCVYVSDEGYSPPGNSRLLLIVDRLLTVKEEVIVLITSES